MNKLNVVITGRRPQTLDVGPDTTLAELVTTLKLDGYDITLDSQPVAKSAYTLTRVYNAKCLWAAQGMKAA